MRSARAMAQEYAKSGFASLLALNGGAAVTMLTQATDLIDMGLADEVAWALVAWALGAALVPLGWLFGFISLRFLDRSEDVGASPAREIGISNRYLFAGEIAFLLSLILFVTGCTFFAIELGSIVPEVPEAVGEAMSKPS